METSSMETSSTETSSSRIILPAKSFFYGNFLPFSGGGGNMPVFITFCAILCKNCAKPRKPSLAWKLLPAKSFFQQNYSSMETFFHFLAEVETYRYLIRFVESYAGNVQSRGNLPGTGNFFQQNYSSSKIILPGKLSSIFWAASGKQFPWKKIMLEENYAGRKFHKRRYLILQRLPI